MDKLKTVCNGIELQAQVDTGDDSINLCMIDKNGEINPFFCLNVEDGYLTLTVWENFGNGRNIFSMKIE